ncbi:DUF3500 domain-containing protein [Kineosporia sp. NBRC 101731]|uniref:DUF3500 domain-containing protein n=1 Tax=Kineosporia sp. NBRC 101731 TaxID=3032199 RepID=UPI0024A6044F|nr:DUF3500 domain-containing protein [Kineosporia sp. NBRC 101731]GLY28807.1 hypothetical protein Kisp02_21720 [Kineosporia sp. NBRC 101731]
MNTKISPHRLFSRSLPGVAIAAGVLLTAACGGSSSSTSSSSSSASTTTATVTQHDVASVVTAAQAFSNSLSDDQKATAILEMTAQNAQAWSNLPCGQSCRGGVAFSDLEDNQLALAKTLLQTALGSGDTGYARAEDLWAADDQLNSLQASGEGGGPGSSGSSAQASGGTMPTDMPSGGTMPSGSAGGGGGGGQGGYGAGLYDLALLGTPSTDGTWMLHFGGHHLGVNFTYKDGEVSGASPYFVGIEPTTWTADDGTEYAPLEAMQKSVAALGTSLTTAQMKTAKLDQAFSDVLLGPGEDGNFPGAKQGIAVSKLSDDQKELVLTAMRQWVGIADDDTATAMMKTYEDELDQTYVGWSGGLEMTAHANYLRIDGPSVWIEFVCQNGVVISNKIHYHTIWRDHTRDYGGEFSS